jgi:iron complex transport system substrate-binding protein
MIIMRVLTRRPRAVSAVTVLAFLTVSGCASAASPSTSGGAANAAAAGGFPVTVSAADGKVHVPQRPDAIISLSPTATEMLYAIGAGSQVTAVDVNSNYPPRAPRTKLSGFSPNVEAIVAYKPDLVIVDGTTGSLVQKLSALSVPVLELPAPVTLSGMYAEFGQLGQATGHLAQAQREETSLRAQISKIAATVPRHSPPLTYYYELDQTYYSLTSATFVGQLLGLLGMKSIADSAHGTAAAGGYPQLSSEFIVRANPGYVILADTVCCHQDAATVAGRPGWAGMTAVKEDRIIALNDDIASRWGPRVVDLLRAVAAAISAKAQPSASASASSSGGT